MNKKNYNRSILDIIKERQSLSQEVDQFVEKIREIESKRDDGLHKINAIFNDLQETNPDLYASLKVQGSNLYRTRFAHNDTLYTIERNMSYTDIYCRIRIQTENINTL